MTANDASKDATETGHSVHYEMMARPNKDNDVANVENAAAALKQEEFMPKPEDAMEALGIPEWRQLEKKIVRRLDMTLMPCLWCLYLINYLDRASIA